MNKLYYANGKLLISGEYLVSRGAKALAIPLKPGQWMKVETHRPSALSQIDWNARMMDKDWFNAVISIPDFEINSSSDTAIANRLVLILRALTEMNNSLFLEGCRYDISTGSAFDHSWGLGSSSALVANLARWGQVDPFDLFFRVANGSGYDVAAALASGPIIYSAINHKVDISPVVFLPDFRNQIWFAYQGHKQDSSESLELFKRQVVTTQHDIEKMNRLTLKFSEAGNLADFIKNIHDHEALISGLLGKIPIKEEKFNDFEGEIKSLGAWGGDFIMIASERPPDYIHEYFTGKGILTMFAFDELVLN